MIPEDKFLSIDDLVINKLKMIGCFGDCYIYKNETEGYLLKEVQLNNIKNYKVVISYSLD